MVTVSKIVDQLGGNGPVATLLGISVQQVSNCKAENRFPPKHYMRLSRECATRKVELPDSLFDSAEPARQATG